MYVPVSKPRLLSLTSALDLRISKKGSRPCTSVRLKPSMNTRERKPVEKITSRLRIRHAVLGRSTVRAGRAGIDANAFPLNLIEACWGMIGICRGQKLKLGGSLIGARTTQNRYHQSSVRHGMTATHFARLYLDRSRSVLTHIGHVQAYVRSFRGRSMVKKISYVFIELR